MADLGVGVMRRNIREALVENGERKKKTNRSIENYRVNFNVESHVLAICFWQIPITVALRRLERA